MADSPSWTKFYSEFANKLLKYRNDRKPLIDAVHEIHKELDFSIMTDKFKDGSSELMQDICPFTAMSEFNRKLTHQNRIHTQSQLANLLGVSVSPPNNWPGVPVLYNRSRWFYPYANTRNPDHIKELWNVLADALAYADNKSSRSKFVESFDTVIRRGTSIRMLTIGLFWIRPYKFLPLDSKTRQYLEEKIKVSNLNLEGGEEYLDLTEKIRTILKKTNANIRSFPELSIAAYEHDIAKKKDNGGGEPESKDGGDSGHDGSQYSIEDIVTDGCFIEKSELQSIKSMLENTKNLILEGPPGTGKTYLAKRLAFALVGHKPDSGVRAIQFHPNLSYEDFVRGYRPDGNGLALRNGPFLDAVNAAKAEPDRKFVIIIEEINRGNPANIFGEMLTLIEADKRSDDDAISLSYPRDKSERVYVPPNIYIIGTMNVADRSIALVDMALRRRFDFVRLDPVFDETWSGWVHEKFRVIKPDILNKIGAAMTSLNERIAEDRILGPNFKIGHSYAIPKTNDKIPDAETWWRRVVEYKISPLLREYWFEDSETALAEKKKLLSVLGT